MARNIKLERALGTLEADIESASKNNKEKAIQEKAVEEISEKLNTANTLLRFCQMVSKKLEIAEVKYRQNRQAELESEARRVLKLIFPGEDFDVKIEWTPGKVRPKAEILTGLRKEDGTVKWCPPKQIHGELAKQVVSFTILANIAIMRGAKFFCSDEVLNSGDDQSLEEAAPLLEKLGEALQFIAIEHKQSYYTNLVRREIDLEKVSTGGNEHSGYVMITNNEIVNPKE